MWKLISKRQIFSFLLSFFCNGFRFVWRPNFSSIFLMFLESCLFGSAQDVDKNTTVTCSSLQNFSLARTFCCRNFSGETLCRNMHFKFHPSSMFSCNNDFFLDRISLNDTMPHFCIYSTDDCVTAARISNLQNGFNQYVGRWFVLLSTNNAKF